MYMILKWNESLGKFACDAKTGLWPILFDCIKQTNHTAPVHDIRRRMSIKIKLNVSFSFQQVGGMYLCVQSIALNIYTMNLLLLLLLLLLWHVLNYCYHRLPVLCIKLTDGHAIKHSWQPQRCNRYALTSIAIMTFDLFIYIDGRLYF